MTAKIISKNVQPPDADDQFEGLLRYVIAQSRNQSETDQVAYALLHFILRTSSTWRSIRTLRDHSPGDERFLVDAGTLLRAMYDAYLQADYVVAEPAETSTRAQDYFEYEHVEFHKWREKVLKHNNSLTAGVKSSADFDAAVNAQDKAYNRVSDRFKARHHWYPGSLSDIARSLGKSDEYDVVLASFQGCVHSSARALRAGPPISAEHVIDAASTVAARVARLNVDHNRIQLVDLHRRILDKWSKPYDFLGNG